MIFTLDDKCVYQFMKDRTRTYNSKPGSKFEEFKKVFIVIYDYKNKVKLNLFQL